MQLSIRRLLVLIAIVATGLAALGRAADNANNIHSFLLGILFLSTIMAVFHPGQIRAFCTGFTLFGFGYLTLTASPLGMHLPTTLAFERLYETAYGPPLLPRDPFDAWAAQKHYHEIGAQYILAGHSLTAFLLALAGGFSIRLLAAYEEGNAGELENPLDGMILTPDYSPARLSRLWNKQ